MTFRNYFLKTRVETKLQPLNIGILARKVIQTHTHTRFYILIDEEHGKMYQIELLCFEWNKKINI